MKTSVTMEDVENSIASEEYLTVGKKTTVCLITMKNGYEVVGTSACVCAENYSEEVGKPYARERAIQQVWAALGAELQAQLASGKMGTESCNGSELTLEDPAAA